MTRHKLKTNKCIKNEDYCITFLFSHCAKKHRASISQIHGIQLHVDYTQQMCGLVLLAKLLPLIMFMHVSIHMECTRHLEQVLGRIPLAFKIVVQDKSSKLT